MRPWIGLARRHIGSEWIEAYTPADVQNTSKPSPDRPPGRRWRRTLVGAIVALAAGVFAVSFINPFTPVFLIQELGLHDARQLAVWTALITSSSSLTQFLTGPLWGMVADRRGRKNMLIRAQLAAGIMISIMGFAQNPPELLALRLLMGLASGVSISAMALVVSETPRGQVGWAVGMTSSARAVALSASPLAAGVLATVVPLRAVFVGGGLLMVCTTLPVFLLVHETAPGVRQHAALSARRQFRLLDQRARASLAILLIGQALIYLAYAGGQQLILLRIIAISTDGSSLPIGVAFGAMGLATGLAAAGYYRLVPKFGFRHLAIGAGVLMGATFAGSAVAPTTLVIAISAAVAGVCFGIGGPALQSMLGLEAPSQIQATLFGAMGSATSLGQATGQLTSGMLAAVIGAPLALSLPVVATLSMAAGLLFWGREPRELVFAQNLVGPIE